MANIPQSDKAKLWLAFQPDKDVNYITLFIYFFFKKIGTLILRSMKCLGLFLMNRKHSTHNQVTFSKRVRVFLSGLCSSVTLPNHLSLLLISYCEYLFFLPVMSSIFEIRMILPKIGTKLSKYFLVYFIALTLLLISYSFTFC